MVSPPSMLRAPLGFPRPRPSPKHSVTGGSCWVPSCPVLSHRVVLVLAHQVSPTQRPLRSARAPSHPHPCRCGSWRSRRVPGFPRSPAVARTAHSDRSQSNRRRKARRRPRRVTPRFRELPKEPLSQGHHRPGSFELRAPEGTWPGPEPKLRARRGKSRGLARQRPRER